MYTHTHTHTHTHKGILFLIQNLAVSSGTSESDAENLKRIVDKVPDIEYLCLDVANGYSEHFVSFVSDIRKQFPNQTLMVSNQIHQYLVILY